MNLFLPDNLQQFQVIFPIGRKKSDRDTILLKSGLHFIRFTLCWRFPLFKKYIFCHLPGSQQYQLLAIDGDIGTDAGTSTILTHRGRGHRYGIPSCRGKIPHHRDADCGHSFRFPPRTARRHNIISPKIRIVTFKSPLPARFSSTKSHHWQAICKKHLAEGAPGFRSRRRSD
jgi:hypothetical protein